MNLFLDAVGNGLALAGSLLLLIDLWPVLRDPRKEAEREVDAAFPRLPEMGHRVHDAAVERVEARLRRRRAFYGSGVALLVAGFVVQVVGALS